MGCACQGGEILATCEMVFWGTVAILRWGVQTFANGCSCPVGDQHEPAEQWPDKWSRRLGIVSPLELLVHGPENHCYR